MAVIFIEIRTKVWEVMEAVTIYLSIYFCLLFLLVLIRFINKLWWNPIWTQSQMRSQGIKGPSYKFIHGNTKEIINMTNEIMSSPMELTHQIFPRVYPHVYSWIKLYGNSNVFLNILVLLYLIKKIFTIISLMIRWRYKLPYVEWSSTSISSRWTWPYQRDTKR